MTAKRPRPGKMSRKISSRLTARSVERVDSPVTLPPGRASEATMPVLTGSAATGKTIGMTAVAFFAARTCSVPPANMRSTLSRTNSAAISAARSLRPSAQRYSIATVRPSIHPSSRSRFKNAASLWLSITGVLCPKNPMVGSFGGCCAPAASGQAVAPPTSAMNSRRLMSNMGAPSPPGGIPHGPRDFRPERMPTVA